MPSDPVQRPKHVAPAGRKVALGNEPPVFEALERQSHTADQRPRRTGYCGPTAALFGLEMATGEYDPTPPAPAKPARGRSTQVKRATQKTPPTHGIAAAR